MSWIGVSDTTDPGWGSASSTTDPSWGASSSTLMSWGATFGFADSTAAGTYPNGVDFSYVCAQHGLVVTSNVYKAIPVRASLVTEGM